MESGKVKYQIWTNFSDQKANNYNFTLYSRIIHTCQLSSGEEYRLANGGEKCSIDTDNLNTYYCDTGEKKFLGEKFASPTQDTCLN